MVTTFRPPIGGNIAAIKLIPHRCLNYLVSRSYHPPLSIHCLKSYIGGCAPYFYFCGIFKSSINITI